MIQTEAHREIIKTEQSIQALWDNVKQSDILGVPEGKERENIFGDIRPNVLQNEWQVSTHRFQRLSRIQGG